MGGFELALYVALVFLGLVVLFGQAKLFEIATQSVDLIKTRVTLLVVVVGFLCSVGGSASPIAISLCWELLSDSESQFDVLLRSRRYLDCGDEKPAEMQKLVLAAVCRMTVKEKSVRMFASRAEFEKDRAAWVGTCPGREVSKRPASQGTESSELPLPALEAGEPWGLALIDAWNGSKSIRLEWGVTKKAAEDLLLSGPQPKTYLHGSPLHCLGAGSDREVCKSSELLWGADFGQGFHARLMPLLYFTKGRFFAYQLPFPSELFLETESVVTSRLGTPVDRSVVEVQNAMGAKFQKIVDRWTTAHTKITLVSRIDSDLTSGSLDLVFLPIESTLPKESPPEAPF